MRAVVYSSNYVALNSYSSLEELLNFSDLEKIEILSLRDFTYYFNGFFDRMKNLKILRIFNSQNDGCFNDLSIFNSLTKLVELTIKGSRIEKIKGIENLEDLIDLNLTNNEIKDLKGLDSLPNLEVLFLRKNNIHSILDIYSQYWKNLVYIDLAYNKIKTFEVPEDLYFLEIVDLSFNEIIEIKGLDRIKSLHTIYLKGNEDIYPKLENLKEIYQNIEFDIVKKTCA